MSDPVTLIAPAKLTVTLKVVGRRADGYHLLESEMLSLDLADELVVAHGPRSLVVEGNDELATDASNLVMRAMELAGLEAAVTLRKAIPAGGGLGGGSSDAAAILRYAGFTDLAAAARLGGDVPFCLRGGRAMVRGIGEHVEVLGFKPYTAVLALLGFPVSTPAVYATYDALPEAQRHHERNDLTAAAEVVAPALRQSRELLEERFGRPFWLAGSGSTMFAEASAAELGLKGDGEVLESPAGSIHLLEVHALPA